MPKSFSIFNACCITSQSLEEPMTTPTIGLTVPDAEESVEEDI
jgi:hypothetical protein